MKKITVRVLVLIIGILTAVSLTACKKVVDISKSVTVPIIDCGVSHNVEGNDGMTVRQLIDAAGLTVGNKDSVTPNQDTVWKDAGADSVIISRYAKVTVSDGQTTKSIELNGGKVSDAIAQAGFDLLSYQSDVDISAYLTDGMTINLTKIENGFISDGVNSYYYSQGVIQKNAVVGSDAEGWFYANADGIIDRGYCDGITVNGDDWIVINGEATKVVTPSDGCLFAAAKDIARCTDSSMTKEDKLKHAFNFIKSNYLEGVLHDPPYREADWPVVCANDLFVYGKGDCFSYGAAFAYMCKAIGCTEVYACNSGGHGWAEAEGKAYDPEWSMHSNNYSYFAVAPGDEVDVNYWTTTSDAEWKRKAI